MSKIINNIREAISIVFTLRSYLILGILSFVIFFALYAFFLPATYTGGRVGFVSLRFLNLKLGLFAFLFSLELAMIISFSTYAFRKKSNKKASVAAGGFFGSILPPLLCCSPFLPSIAAFLGGIFPFAFGVSGFLQGFIATHETYIYLVIVLILAYSVFLNAKQVISADCNVCI